MEIGGFLGLDWCYVCGSVLHVGLDRCCGFGLVLLWNGVVGLDRCYCGCVL